MAHYWFISSKYRRNAKLALFTFGLAFIVILLGAFTRLTDSGLSCPDWPNCFGYLTAPHTTTQLKSASAAYPLTTINVRGAWTEMIHRYFAGTEGILILALALTTLLARKAKGFKSHFIGIALILLLGIQVTLGMLTVTEKLRPVIVLGHLVTGLSLLSFLWWAYLDLHLQDDSFIQRSRAFISPWLWIGFLIVVAQIILGGWVSTHYAGLACIDFPYCNGQVLPAIQWHALNTDLISIHMLHRIGALVTATYLICLAFFLLQQPAFKTIAKFIFALLCIQISLGISNIILYRPVWIALCHHMVAILLLLTMITALVKASYVSGRRHVFFRT